MPRQDTRSTSYLVSALLKLTTWPRRSCALFFSVSGLEDATSSISICLTAGLPSNKSVCTCGQSVTIQDATQIRDLLYDTPCLELELAPSSKACYSSWVRFLTSPSTTLVSAAPTDMLLVQAVAPDAETRCFSNMGTLARNIPLISNLKVRSTYVRVWTGTCCVYTRVSGVCICPVDIRGQEKKLRQKARGSRIESFLGKYTRPGGEV